MFTTEPVIQLCLSLAAIGSVLASMAANANATEQEVRIRLVSIGWNSSRLRRQSEAECVQGKAEQNQQERFVRL
jgi:hypothetical protein